MARKRTIVRVISDALSVLEFVSPTWAARWARRLFFTPGGRRTAARGDEVMARASRFQMEISGKKLVGYSWGAGSPVLLVHGWGGSTAQFSQMVAPLVEAGHRVVALDLPAHGASSGHQTNVFEFRTALLELAKREGPFRAVVAHSLGSMAVTLALRGGLPAERVVLVAPMTSFTFAVNEFSRELGLSHRLKARATGEIVASFGGERDLELVRCASEMHTPLLVLHDEDDRRVPTQLGRELAALWPRASYFETQGLGHKRLLGDSEVVSRIVDFVEPSGVEIQPESGRFGVVTTPPVRAAS